MVNFRQPYLASSFRDFWHRWHISLSTWLRDYLYIPLGGSREPGYKTYRNLLCTMLLGGLWHGANWTFVVWGGLHGTALAIDRKIADARRLATKGLSPFGVWPKRVALFHLVCLGWIFFRASSFQEAFAWIAAAGRITWQPEYAMAVKFLILFATPLFLLDLYLEHSNQEYFLQERTPLIRVACAACVLAVITFFSANKANAFIYFQF
jgi:D-alanyl-lipoteichoic acid acyltransferase DltB (MBOAT superfamily)